MALKHIIDSIEGLPDAVAKEYKEKDGKFYLQTEGLVPKERLDEFRDNNIELKRKNSDLEKRLDGFGDMTPEEIEALKIKASKGGDLSDEDKKALIESEVLKRTEKMKSDYDSKIDSLSSELGTSKVELSKLLIDNGLKSAGISLGVKSEAMIDFINRGKETFKLVDGVAVPMKGEDIVYGTDGKTPLSMEDWATELSSNAPHLFGESSGSGGRHRQSASSSGAGNEGLRGVSRMRAARTS